jgi:tRNA threonylcarbamoyladenosine biosynthesis protein TsaE
MRIISQTRRQTLAIGRAISGLLHPGDIVCLFGELGSGKTTLAQGIAVGLGIPVSGVLSPTFVILRQFKTGRLALYHFDLYRLGQPQLIEEIGYSDYFYADGVTVIEWPERLGYLLPKDYLKIELRIKAADMRLFVFSGQGERARQLCRDIRRILGEKKLHVAGKAKK